MEDDSVRCHFYDTLRARFAPPSPRAGEDPTPSASNRRWEATSGGPGSVLHAAQDLVLAPFADEAVVLARLGEAEPGEVPDQHQHEDDGDVVGYRHDRPEVLQRSHAPSAGFPCTRGVLCGQCAPCAKHAANRRTRVPP